MTATYPHPVRTEWKLLALLRKENPGITQADCALTLNVNQNTIRHWLQKPLYQSYENWLLTTAYENTPLAVKRSRAVMQEEIGEFASEMLDRLRDIVETSKDERLVANIGFDMLDRAGYAEPKRDAARSIQVVLTPEVLQMLARRSQEIASGEIVVGEVISSEQHVR